MSESVLAVNTVELRKLLNLRPFIALPQEEIDRLYAGIEIYSIDHERAETDPSITQLTIFTVVHYNYSWLTFIKCMPDITNRSTSIRSAGLTGHVHSVGNNYLFLDDSLKKEVCRIIDDSILTNAGYHTRLAGLLFDNSDQYGRSHLGLVYVARLSRTGVEIKNDGIEKIELYGTGQLQEFRNQFDCWSRIVIDHIVAL
ncbi:MAG TPA: hypothetical protein VHP36_00750 [Chitinispirillaceae bacterium]|nr:hypothetical protein [Chitinispirillaceae bacterium]